MRATTAVALASPGPGFDERTVIEPQHAVHTMLQSISVLHIAILFLRLMAGNLRSATRNQSPSPEANLHDQEFPTY